MIRGTTPIHTFTIPFDTSLIAKCKIVYVQDGAEVLSKKTEDCELGDRTITTRLSQKDTFLFDCKKCVEIQLRVLTKTDEAFASIPIKVGVDRCLDSEVLE